MADEKEVKAKVGVIEISVTAPKAGIDEETGKVKEAFITADVGNDLQDAADKFGAEPVHAAAVKQWIVDGQRVMRTLMEQGTLPSQVPAKMQELGWAPGKSVRVGGDPGKAFLKMYQSWSPDQRREWCDANGVDFAG